MTRFVIVCIVLTFLCIHAAEATAAPTTSSCGPNAIGWQAASRSVGKTVTLSGTALGAHYTLWKSGKGSMTFLDFGHKYPATPRFTVVVWDKDVSALAGKHVCVTGKVSIYKGEAELDATKIRAA